VLMVSYCGQWLSVVRRRPSCVVRRVSTFDVYTLETTFVIHFFKNFVRMFVLNLGQVRIWVMSGQKLGHQVKS